MTTSQINNYIDNMSMAELDALTAFLAREAKRLGAFPADGLVGLAAFYLPAAEYNELMNAWILAH